MGLERQRLAVVNTIITPSVIIQEQQKDKKASPQNCHTICKETAQIPSSVFGKKIFHLRHILRMKKGRNTEERRKYLAI